jgi:TPR repeat protein
LTGEQASALNVKAAAGDQAALKTLQDEAQNGNPNAQVSIGALYAEGKGVAQDWSQALQWTRKAAEQGAAHAQYNLGVFHARGNGVTQDWGQAAQWWRQAAQQGDGRAQNSLGYLYDSGQGVTQSKVAAYALYSLSAAQDNGAADSMAAANRATLARGMSAQQIEAGQTLTGKMRVAGNFLSALDEYLAAQAAGP